MPHRSLFTGRALVGVTIALSTLAIAPHASTKAVAATPVIAVYDATTESHCKMWRDHNVAQAWACPPGSVIYTVAEPLATAEAARQSYVVPSSDPAVTERDITAMANALHTSLTPLTVTPNTNCGNFSVGEGGKYNAYGGAPAISYWVQFNESSTCALTSVQDQAERSGSPDEYWQFSAVK